MFLAVNSEITFGVVVVAVILVVVLLAIFGKKSKPAINPIAIVKGSDSIPIFEIYQSGNEFTIHNLKNPELQHASFSTWDDAANFIQLEINDWFLDRYEIINIEK